MGRGGHRPGSGRKPGPQGPRVLVGMPSRQPVVTVPIAPVDEGERQRLLTAPDGLSKEAQLVWIKLAEHAIAERTLTPATAAGFAQLCQQWVYLDALDKKIQHLGPDTKEASPYFQTWKAVVMRVDASLARFKLTAFGKPATKEKPKAAVNPWAQLGTP